MLSKSQYNIYNFITFFLIFCYILTLLNINLVDVNKIHILFIIIHIGLCIFVLIRFNIFTDVSLTINKYENNFVFTVGLLLLFKTIVYDVGIKLNLDFLKKYF